MSQSQCGRKTLGRTGSISVDLVFTQPLDAQYVCKLGRVGEGDLQGKGVQILQAVPLIELRLHSRHRLYSTFDPVFLLPTHHRHH